MKLQQKAFTLVELIVVITILAILGTIAFISMSGYSKSSRDSVRISDVSNMKTSLELFHLNAGKYPLPDNNEIVNYDTQTLWYQGTFGSIVVSNLSRNLNEIPTDPLTDKEYIFSVANNKNEFEILSLLEGDLAINTISQTNATTLTVTPRIDGTYNGVFIKTAGYIVPVPSIVTSEIITGGMTLDGTNIQSQVTNLGKNIPNVGNVVSATGKLPGLELSVFTGTIKKDDLDSKKELVMLAIQGAYTNSVLANDDIYKYILSVSGETELAGLLDVVVLKGVVSTIISEGPSGPYLGCTGTGQIIEAATKYGSCDTYDIIVCAGTGSGYTMSACNVGATIAGTGSSSYGDYFQGGRNKGFSYSDSSHELTTIDGSIGLNAGTDDYGFVRGTSITTWANTDITDNWGDITDTLEARQGPCEIGYHIPEDFEWLGVLLAGDGGLSTWDISGTDTEGIDIENALKLPQTGERNWYDGTMRSSGNIYWTSTETSTNPVYGESFYITSSFITITSRVKAGGYNIRCFKN